MSRARDEDRRDEQARAPIPASQPGAPRCRPPMVDVLCPVCGIEMHPEHAHYRCLQCGYRDSCCF